MAEAYNFDDVSQLEAGTVGEPGQRTFFVLVAANDGWVRLWLEKEQLRALAEGIDELLEQIARETADPPDPMPQANIPATPMLGEFQVGRLAVGRDGERDRIVLIAQAVDSPPNLPTLTCRVSLQQASDMADQAIEVVNAGRPICPMCEQPIDPAGHLCPRSNGHRSSGL